MQLRTDIENTCTMQKPELRHNDIHVHITFRNALS